MIRMFSALLFAVLVPGIVYAQTTEEKLAALRSDMAKMKSLMTEIVTAQTQQAQQLNGISAVQSRMQGDIMNIDERLAKFEAKMDAVLAATNTTLTASSTSGWDSTTSFAASPTRTSQPPMAQPMPQAAPQRLMFMPQQVMYSGGGCANGSCGTGRGLFHRR